LLSGGVKRQGQAELSDYYWANLKRFPQLVARLKSPYPQQAIESSGGVNLEVSRCHARRVLLVGDAAGAVDPITGQGMTVALKDAEAASDFLRTRLPQDRLSENDLAPYAALRKNYFNPAVGLSQLVLFMVQHPFVARRAMRSLSRNPSLRKKTVLAVSQVSSSHVLSSWDQCRLLLGV
jgi:2-polyprenyl-6-methoxyphenol hydroxylase-like FAD-dependent oxidoreductase